MTTTNERREFTRLEVPLDAEVRFGSELIHGKVENVSLKGCLLWADHWPEDDVPCEVTLFFAGREHEMSIGSHGKIVRHIGQSEVGIQFGDLSFDSFQHLKNLILMNSDGEIEQVEAEIANHAGIRQR